MEEVEREIDAVLTAFTVWRQLSGQYLTPRALATFVRVGMALPPANDGLWGDMVHDGAIDP